MEASVLGLLPLLPVIFFAAVPTPTAAITFWVVLFPENEGQMAAFDSYSITSSFYSTPRLGCCFGGVHARFLVLEPLTACIEVGCQPRGAKHTSITMKFDCLRILAVSLLCISTTGVQAQAPVQSASSQLPEDYPEKILFVGNSFTYYNDGLHMQYGNLLRAANLYEEGRNELRMMTYSVLVCGHPQL